MKPFTKELLRSALIGFVLPAVLLTIAVFAAGGTEGGAEGPSTAATPPGPAQTTTTILNAAAEPVYLSVLHDGTVTQMELEEYLLGVLIAEMPAGFEPDALKAQAVAARTFALYCDQTGCKHTNAAVCTNSSCCQGYMSVETYYSKGGTEANVQKLQRAIRDTSGQVLTYQGKLIMATYFDCSGGTTEAAVAVWGYDVPYLQSVSSPGEENAVHYNEEKTFTLPQFCAALGVQLTGDSAAWFGPVTYTAGGGVDTLEICGVSYRGTTLRTLLGLRSTAFEITVSADAITFVTRGHGHRVGLSQYGADAMALTGCNYIDILTYYYQGTEIVEYSP